MNLCRFGLVSSPEQDLGGQKEGPWLSKVQEGDGHRSGDRGVPVADRVGGIDRVDIARFAVPVNEYSIPADIAKVRTAHSIPTGIAAKLRTAHSISKGIAKVWFGHENFDIVGIASILKR